MPSEATQGMLGWLDGFPVRTIFHFLQNILILRFPDGVLPSQLAEMSARGEDPGAKVRTGMVGAPQPSRRNLCERIGRVPWKVASLPVLEQKNGLPENPTKDGLNPPKDSDPLF